MSAGCEKTMVFFADTGLPDFEATLEKPIRFRERSFTAYEVPLRRPVMTSGLVSMVFQVVPLSMLHWVKVMVEPLSDPTEKGSVRD